LYVRWRIACRERAFVGLGLLPEDADFSARARKPALPIRQRVTRLHEGEQGFLPYLIDLGILQFMASRSVGANRHGHRQFAGTHRPPGGPQLRLLPLPGMGHPDPGFHRYGGFGIAMALQAISPDAPDLRQLTASLGVAFYTTLVATVQSAFLVFGFADHPGHGRSTGVNLAGQYVFKEPGQPTLRRLTAALTCQGIPS
jgi:hypothetical protein